MSQQLRFSTWCASSWRGGAAERLWLSMLVDAMEQAAEPGEPCDADAREFLRAQLAVPARPPFASPFSLRN